VRARAAAPVARRGGARALAPRRVRGGARAAGAREIIKLEKEAAAAAKARAAQAQTSDSAGLGAAARVLQPAALLLLAVLFWGQPLAEGLPAHALGPGVATLLAFPGLPRGSLGVLAWLGICYVVAARVTAAVSRALGFATGAEPEEAGLMGMLKSALR
jgi:hypothetical protein